MMNKYALLFLLLASLTGCATTPSQDTRAAAKHAVIVNAFPATPNYLLVSARRSDNVQGTVDDPSLRGALSAHLAQLLRGKGYSVEIVDSGDADSNRGLVIEIRPRSDYQLINSIGFGFYRKGPSTEPSLQLSYAALDLKPRQDGKSLCASCYGESRSPLSIANMPDQWSELDAAEQAALKESLRGDIRQAVETAFAKTSL